MAATAASAGAPPAPGEYDPLAAVTASLAASSAAYLEPARTHWDPGEEATARAVISPVSGGDLAASRPARK